MLKSCPDSVDITDLQFKLQCRLKIFENDSSSFSNVNSLVTCASRFGLIFVGTNSKHFQVIQTQNLHTYTPKDKDVIDYRRRNIDLPSSPRHLCVNCDNTIIAVVVEKSQCAVVLFYEVLSFLSHYVNVIKEIRLSSTPNVYVKEINWNPSLPAIFTACKSDGTLGVYELKGGESVDINELPAASGASCFCWSPKGKQIAVGSKDGKITQYKPDLKAVKVINEPKLGDPHMLISLQWVSNYQFIGVYQSIQPEGSSCVIVVDAPKTGESSYTNYDDICYSGSSRPPQYYLILQQHWNFLMVASANSSEVVVLGSSGDSWTQWIMSDTARAELPLSSDHQETLPVGLTFDISSTTPLPWGESTIPPCPLLCILSDHGVLCCFNVVYLKEGIPSICTPADSVQDTSGLSSFVTTSGNNTTVSEIVQSRPSQPSSVQSQFAAPTRKPNISESIPVPKATVPFTTVAQSTPLIPGKIRTDISSKTLFDGEATLTPIKPQQSSQGVSLFGGQTLISSVSQGSNASAPIINTMVSQSANPNTEKYVSIFSSLNPTTFSPTTTVPVKPIVISAAATAPKPEAVIKSQENFTTKVPDVSALKEISQPVIPKQEPQILDPKLKAEASAMLSQMIKDELMYLEAELKVLLNQGRTIKVNLGIDEEKIDMITQIEYLREFVKEAVDISVGQSSEIHCLKQNLIQSWAWFEEANSYYNSSKNETLLLKLQPLDSVSQKRVKDIEQLTYYIESQLYQTSKTLDEQWGNFQDYAKKTYKVQMPTMEAIFQTMVSQNAILKNRMYVLKDISLCLKKKKFGIGSLLLSLDKAENLSEDLKELRLEPHDILLLQYEKIKNHTKILSSKKANMLRSLLKQREVTHVTAIRPQVSSWTINQSPASRMRHSISILGTQMSPVSKSTVVKNLTFVQSTPLKVSEASKSTQVSQGLIFSSRTAEKPSFSVTPNASPASSGFVSLAKSGPGISNSQGSAFAPIGFAPTSSATSEPQQIFPKTSFSSMPFSFGSASANTSKAAPTATQINTCFSLPSVSNTAPLVTTTISEPNTNLSGYAKSVFKSTSQSTQFTAAPPSSSFSFGSGNSTTKNIFGVAASITGNLTDSNNLFLSTSSSSNSFLTTSSSSVFNNSSTQVIQPTNVTTTVSTTVNVKPVQSPVSQSIFGSQQSSFAPLSKSASVTIITTAVSTSTPPKTSSGVASIFANLQSVIDKATGNSAAIPASAETSKPAFSFGVSSGATTTTQSLFGSVSSTSTTKSLFGTTTLSEGVGVFGNISKPTETLTSASTTPSIFGSSANSFTATTTSSSKPEEPRILVETPKSSESTKDVVVTPTVIATTAVSKNYESSTLPTTSQVSIFGPKPSPLSSNTSISHGVLPVTTTTTATTTTSVTSSLFSTSAITTVSEPMANIFAAPVTTNATNEKITSIFGSSKTTSLTASSVFGTTVQSSPIFGNTAPVITTSAAPSITESDVFSASTLTSQSSNNIFVSGNSGSIFRKPNTTATAVSEANTFGTLTTTSASVFGTSTPGNIFGTPSTASTDAFLPPTTNTFGSPNTLPNVFIPSGSIFSNTSVPSTTNIFGPQTTTSTNIFGTSTSPSSTNIFGGAAPASTAPNIFGNTTTTAAPFGAQSGSIFGTPKTTGSVFGQQDNFGSQATTASSIFRQPATFGSGTASFGSSTASSEFGSGFGATSTTNTFGSQATSQVSSTGSFGFGTLSVDGTSSPTGSIFGGSSGGAFGATQAANPFGKVENKTPFGSSSANIFGSSASGATTTNIFASPATTASSIFGSGTTFGAGNAGGAFGSASTFGSSGFGTNPAFGQSATFGSNTFGSSQSGSFSSAGGASPIAQSGFSAPVAFQKPSGFGSPPVFGGSPAPAFGAAPSFGGAPAFGGSPTFGSPEKVFGTSQPASSGFGAAATQQTAGFGNLASQNTIGFGSLAQQASSPSSSPFASGNSSFSSWR